MARLSDPVTSLKGVGPARAKQLENLNIYTLGDLICHFPRGYEDRTKLVPIAQLQADVTACFRAVEAGGCARLLPGRGHDHTQDGPYPKGDGPDQGVCGGLLRAHQSDLF